MIDTGPFVGKLMANALTVADYVIIPTEAGADSTRGVGKLINSVSVAQRSINDKVEVAAIVINRREWTGEQDFREQELRDQYGELVAKNVIPKRAAAPDAHGLATPIYRLKGSGALAVASAYRDLATELQLI